MRKRRYSLTEVDSPEKRRDKRVFVAVLIGVAACSAALAWGTVIVVQDIPRFTPGTDRVQDGYPSELPNPFESQFPDTNTPLTSSPSYFESPHSSVDTESPTSSPTDYVISPSSSLNP